MQNKFFKKYIYLIAATSALSGVVFANDKANSQPLSLVSSADTFIAGNSQPNSVVTLDFSVQEALSWDAEGSSQNVLENCINGSVITGFKWNNIRLETTGNSYFSEAAMNFSDSTGDTGPHIFVGFGSESSGVSFFSSEGVFDLTDNNISDVTSTANQQFLLEFYEAVDDASNSVDAKYTSGTIEVHGVDLTATANCPFISNEIVEADLAVSLDTESEALRIGDELDLLVTVENLGTAQATHIKLNYLAPYQLEIISSSCSDGSVGIIANNKFEVDLVDLNVLESTSCHIVSKLVHYGEINNSVTVSADSDADASNNSGNLVLGGGAFRVPVNNWLAISLLILTLLMFSRKKVFQ